MFDVILAVIIILIGNIIVERINNHRLKKKQHMFIHCPKCGDELIKNGEFVKDDNGIFKYRCTRCGNITFWDFVNFPAPILRTCGECKYLLDDGCRYAYCEKDEQGKCCPDTQVLFERRKLS